MTKKSAASLKADTKGVIKKNGNREITPELDSALRIDVIDSFPNSKDGGSIMESLFGQMAYIAPVSVTDYTPKKYVDDLIGSNGGLKDWSATKVYAIGDTVIYQGMLYRAAVANTNKPPGGTEWGLQIINTSAYDGGWSGSQFAPTQQAVYNAFQVAYSDILDLYNELDYYLPLAGGTMSGPIVYPSMSTGPQLRIGYIEMQGYGLNNSFFGDNIYFDGSQFRYRGTGNGTLFYFEGSGFNVRTAPMGNAGDVATPTKKFEITNAGTSINYGETINFNNDWKYDGQKDQPGSGRRRFIPGTNPDGSGASYEFEYWNSVSGSYQAIGNIS